MSKYLARRPSASMLVAIIALIVALGGTSYAAFSLPNNSVRTRNLRDGSVTTKKLKNGAVTTAKLKNGAVTGAKIATGTVTGSKIDLATLGTVPSAASVGGVTVKAFSTQVPAGGATTLLDTGFATLKATCSPAGQHNVTLEKNSGAPSEVAGFSAAPTAIDNTVNNGGYSNFTGPTSIAASGTAPGSVIHGELATSTGKSLTINMLGRSSTNFSPALGVCVFSGTAAFN